MAEDIKIIWDDDTFQGDIGYNNGDLTRELGLETAVMMSLFTDRRASIDDILPDSNNTDKKGWWGDQVVVEEGDQIGSKLWLLSRGKTDQDTIVKAEGYSKEALQWMLDDGVSAKNEVIVERIERPDGSSTLAIKVEIYQQDGNVIALEFNDIWQGQFGG